MTAPLTDEQVQAYRALRPDCPTCEGAGCDLDFCRDCGDEYTEPCVRHAGCSVQCDKCCPDCTDGKMPLDRWVALLVETLAPLPASLTDIALTIPSCSHSDVQEGDCDWLLRDHVRRIDAVLKMVPK